MTDALGPSVRYTYPAEGHKDLPGDRSEMGLVEGQMSQVRALHRWVVAMSDFGEAIQGEGAAKLSEQQARVAR